MIYRRLTILTVLCCAFSLTCAQVQQEDGKRTCITNEMVEKFLASHPELAGEIKALEESAEVEYQGDRATKIFPMVFHIMHTYSSSDYISNDQVSSAVKVLNDDFQNLSGDTSLVVAAFKNIIGNPNWEFRLARKDPNGNCTNGITRWFYPLTEEASESVKEFAPTWPRNKYINVWVVKGIEGGAGGYTYNPSTAQFTPNYDGIVVVNTQFGTTGTSYNSLFSKRTLSHEVGHFFNLRHTWGNTNTPGLSSNCNSDDNVNDTPNTIGVANQSCNTLQVTCNSLDNVQNIMDYSSCPLMFTVGQATRMINAANSGTAQRNNLSTANNLIATGTQNGYTDTICVPLSDFIATPQTICAGGTVSLMDMSWRGTPTSWTYTLTSGNNTLSASGPNPNVTIPNPGIYDITLLTSNSAGQNSKTKANYLAVFPASAMYNSSNYFDDFESNPIQGGLWFTMKDDPVNGWQESSAASVSGSKSVFVRNGNIMKYSKQSIVSPSYDLSQTSNPYLKFKYAFAKKADDNNDFLRIYISTNCGTTWSLIPPGISASATSGPTAPNTSGNFVPNSSQWKQFSVKIPTSYQNSTNVRFRFELTNGGGNHFYIDDLNIGDQFASQKEILENEYSFSCYPNPANDILQLKLDHVFGYFKWQILDASGRMVDGNYVMASGTVNETIALHSFNSGLYFLRIILPDGLVHVEKILVAH